MKRMSFVLGLALVATACNRPPGTSQTAASACADSATVVATVGGKPITMGELDRAAAQDLFEAREKALDHMVSDRVLEVEAKKVGQTPDQFLRKKVEERVPEITQAEAQDFFNKYKDRMGPQFSNKKFEEVSAEIIQGLTGQKRQQAVPALLADLKKSAGVKILLNKPRVQVAATGPSKGPATAKVTIVEFSDFQCPYCSKGRQVMDEVMKAYDGKVRLVFRDFPLSIHPNADRAAQAGHCADDQGKFWAMHDWMFSNQDSLDAAKLKAAAGTLGIDTGKFAACLDSGKYAAVVASSLEAGQAAGVKGTPAFFVNGVFLNGALPLEQFKEEIDRALGQ